MYILEADDLQWIIKREKTNQKTGLPYFGEARYFQTLEQVKKYVVERSLQIHGLDGLLEAKKELKLLMDSLKDSDFVRVKLKKGKPLTEDFET